MNGCFSLHLGLASGLSKVIYYIIGILFYLYYNTCIISCIVITLTLIFTIKSGFDYFIICFFVIQIPWSLWMAGEFHWPIWLGCVHTSTKRQSESSFAENICKFYKLPIKCMLYCKSLWDLYVLSRESVWFWVCVVSMVNYIIDFEQRYIPMKMYDSICAGL